VKTVAENEILQDALTKVTPGPLIGFGGLTVAPLLRFDAADPDWLTLDEAIAAGSLTVTEVSQAGSVPTLRVVNGGDRTVLLLDSEELVGAKQNRILNTFMLIGSGQTVEIPVSCVEQGRWAYRSRAFRGAPRSLYASLRRKKAARVYESLLVGAGHQADQGEIWAHLEERAEAFGVASLTCAMSEVFESRAGDLAAYQETFRPLAGQVGAVVYGGGEWWGLELLPGPALFGKAWARLLPGYAMDALFAQVAADPRESAEERLGVILRASAEVFPAVGLGEDYRLRGAGFIGAALLAEGRVAHLMGFAQ